MIQCNVCKAKLTNGLDTFGPPQTPVCWVHFWEDKRTVLPSYKSVDQTDIMQFLNSKNKSRSAHVGDHMTLLAWNESCRLTLKETLNDT